MVQLIKISDKCKTGDDVINLLIFLFISGTLPVTECSKHECDVDQDEQLDPVGNNCYVNDGFNRTMLYRAWRPSCNNLHLLSDEIATDYLSYILDYSDTLHYGTEIVFRCLPGYMLPVDSHSYVSMKFKTCSYVIMLLIKILIMGIVRK